MADVRAMMLDNRMGDIKIEPFNGERTKWQEWRQSTEAFFSVMGWDNYADTSAAETAVIRNEFMNEEARNASRMLHALLLVKVKGRAAPMIALAGKHQGWEAWCRMVADYEPNLPGRHAHMLRSILNPEFKNAESFLDELL